MKDSIYWAMENHYKLWFPFKLYRQSLDTSPGIPEEGNKEIVETWLRRRYVEWIKNEEDEEELDDRYLSAFLMASRIMESAGLHALTIKVKVIERV